MKRMKTWDFRSIVIGLLAGFLMGIAVEGLAAFVGSTRGGALQWAQIAGLLLGVIGVWLLARRLAKAEGPKIYRPGRTWLEMEYEVQDAHKKNERALRESGGEEHRMPRPRSSGATLWMDIGLLLSGLVPMCISLPR